MIVCHCKGLTDRDIRNAVRNGANSPSDVSRLCAAASDCGGCRPLIDEIISKENPVEHRDHTRAGG